MREAKTALETAAGLDACPGTKEALLAGEVSLNQAAEIVKTEAAAPGSESDLLDFASRRGVTALKDEGRRRRQATDDTEDRYRRQRRERYWRHWQDEDGMIHVAGAFTPEVGVALSNRIDAEVDRLLRAAKRDGEGPAQTPERTAADAVAKLVMGAESRRPRSAELVLVCDIGAFQRGYAEPGEHCHVIGGGMVPVSVAQELATAAFIKAVLYRGKQIDTLAHFGRHLNAELRTALGLGEPPLFTGVRCAGCGRRYGLQWDHLNPVANRGPTSYENLQPLCWPCHQDKTRRDGEAGLLGPHPTGRARNPKSVAGREKP